MALLMWSCSGVLASSIVRIPTFEVLSVAFSISFGVTAVVLTIRKQWYKVKQPLILWIIGMVGVFGNDSLFIAAFKYAPAAQVDLINYLYPVFIILFAGFLPHEKISVKYIIAAILGFCGVYLVVTQGHGFAEFELGYFPGYVLAFFDALVWSVYCVVARYYKNIPTQMVGMYCGCGLLLSLISHFSFEVTVLPHMNEWPVLCIMGLASQGSAYFLWDYGIKWGNFKLLSILSYANPVIAVLLLIAAGKAHYTPLLIISSLLIASGGVVAGIGQKSTRLAESY